MSGPSFLRGVLAALLAVAVVLAAQKPGGEPGVSFTADLYPIFQEAGCRACHNPKGVASATRLQFPEADAEPAQIEAFGKSLAVLVDRQQPEKSLLLNKPTRRIPHTGGERIPPGTKEEVALRRWVQYLAALPPEEAAAARKRLTPEPSAGTASSTPLLRRLTHSQYNNTVRDLLGDVSNPANQFPPEDFIGGFKNQYQGQGIPPLLAEAYSLAAEKLAGNAFRGGDTRRLILCAPAAPDDAACRAKFVREFGRRAFRRPLTTEELARYSVLHAQEARASGDFLKGAQVVVEGILQSPHFLFRLERTPDPKLRPYALASRLSYFLWDSMPDEALFASAASGELDAPAGQERVARRMLDSPKARRAVDEFVSQWLRFDRVVNAVKDRRQFPQFTIELALAMTEETRRFVSYLVWSDRNFTEFFTADYSFLNADLASLYNLPAPAQDFDRVAFAPDSTRAGILGQGTFLSLTSKPGETSPTARGLFVREQFLCQQVPDPPPGTNTNLPPISEARPLTNRERLAVHLGNESCATCHRLIDPIGFGLEKFDPVGARREKLKLTFFPDRRNRDAPPKSAELDLDTTGWIAGIEDSQFTSPRELGRVLASSPQCQECLVKQLFRYATGREETAGDRPVVARIYQDFRDSQFHFKELMIALLKWTEFPPAGL